MILVCGNKIYDLSKAAEIHVLDDGIRLYWAGKDPFEYNRWIYFKKLKETERKNLTSILASSKNKDVVYSLENFLKMAKSKNIDFSVDTR